ASASRPPTSTSTRRSTLSKRSSTAAGSPRAWTPPAPRPKERNNENRGKHPKRELWFFAIRIAEHFEFRPDWYRGGAVAALVLEYYVLLRSVLRAKPHLRACLTRCRHCRIFFLTHPRNAGRQDLRCPFGCREAHRKQASGQRSAAYYGGPKGKRKKSDLNQRRPRKYCAPMPTTRPPP